MLQYPYYVIPPCIITNSVITNGIQKSLHQVIIFQSGLLQICSRFPDCLANIDNGWVATKKLLESAKAGKVVVNKFIR